MTEKPVSRASLVFQGYDMIRDKVTNNARIESCTRLRLFKLNVATICGKGGKFSKWTTEVNAVVKIIFTPVAREQLRERKLTTFPTLHAILDK